MWSLSQLCQDPDTCVSALQKRGDQEVESVVARILLIDEQRRSLRSEYDTTQARSKQLARELGEQLRRKPHDPKAMGLRKEAIACKAQSGALSHQLQHIEKEQKQLLLSLPNAPHASVPEGKSEKDNELIRISELPAQKSHALRPHWSLIGKEGLDFESGSRVSGSGFVFFKGKIARLVRALTSFFLDKAIDAGYEEVIPPLLVNEQAVLGTGQLPDKEKQMYTLEGEPYYLIPTAEVPITNLYRETILSSQQIPLRHVGCTPCFRREAGSWGKDVRGLNRVHQFDKVEIVHICEPETSYQALEEMLTHVESLLKALELPYRLVKLCAADLGFAAALTYDFETYTAAQKKWLEVSSVSNFECFQARRMNLRYRNASSKLVHPHTLNGSALAIPRILASLLENGQDAKQIHLPSSLIPYTGFSTIPITGTD